MIAARVRTVPRREPCDDGDDGDDGDGDDGDEDGVVDIRMIIHIHA
jgi:hypothetical protein